MCRHSQQCPSAVKLVDNTKPGRFRFITLWLADPHMRLISTANVPPQRVDWWADAVLGGSEPQAARGNMPPELLRVLVDQIDKKAPRGFSGLGIPEQTLARITGGQPCRLPPEILDLVGEYDALPRGLMSAQVASSRRKDLLESQERVEEEVMMSWEDMRYTILDDHDVFGSDDDFEYTDSEGSLYGAYDAVYQELAGSLPETFFTNSELGWEQG